MSPSLLVAMAGIAAATLISEDATAVGAGVAVGEGHIGFWPAMAACAVGIYLGDLALWGAGRFGGRRVLTWPGVRMHAGSVMSLGAWIDRRPAAAILGSRFVPGSRLPVYVAAGACGTRHAAFFLWALVAVMLWTPVIVGLGLWLGAAVSGPLATWGGAGWVIRAALVVGIVGALRHGGRRAAQPFRPAMADSLRRWEFWPSWLFNLPVAAWCVLLAVRHRSLTVFTLANPGMPDGGFVGESKSAILAMLPQDWVVPWAVVEPGPLTDRLAALDETMRGRGWQFPLVFKPDVGQRGSGVRWLQDRAQAAAYLAGESRRVVVQLPHEGPFEAGLFYVRCPGESRGRLFSITDKRFPVAVGDGQSTVAELIARHDRYRMQAEVFLRRLGDARHRVPEPGERVALGRAGNHCQGTQFLNGQCLATPELERRVDAIAQQVDGFYFGRFDVRYRNQSAFMAGQDLAIVELNGVTSEATHIYDPSGSLLEGWQTLMRQWAIAFAIGAANRARGHRPPGLLRLARLVWTFARSAPAYPLSD
jgi:membrane protein DedA with SNARE-associated domain